MKIIKKTSAIIIASMALIFIMAGCSKKEELVNFSFTSHKDGQRVSSHHPRTIRGTITNFNELPDDVRNNLNIYLIEQSTRESIWHIEPRGSVDKDGNWRAITWLGNRRQGNRNTFNVCVFASEERLKLNDGDHPVDEKPDNIGEACIQIKRVD